jgi:hypothetical protein
MTVLRPLVPRRIAFTALGGAPIALIAIAIKIFRIVCVRFLTG